MWREIKRLIQQGERFAITTHINPDGDGIGSAVALAELLLLQGKKVHFVCDSPIPEKFHFLDFHQLYRPYHSSEEFLPLDVLIVLDTYKEERIGRVAELISQPGVTSVCIDHHPTEKAFTPYAVIDPTACSVGSMVYTLFKESGYDLNYNAAMGIYTSVISDTGRFSYASTSRKAHKLADECIRVGVDPSQMYARLFQQVPLDQIRIFANALQRMEFHLNNKIVLQQIRLSDYYHLTSQYDLSLIQDFDYIHEFNKTIKGIECAIILWELPEEAVRVSLRSNSGLDIVEPMRKLGGGGHPNAAGALVQGSFEFAKKIVLDLLNESLVSNRAVEALT